jgi:hypothetical protein
LRVKASMRRALALAFLVSLIAPACREQAPAGLPEPERLERMLAYEITITGSTPGRFAGDAHVLTVRLDDARFPQFRWFGLENKEWVDIGGGWRAFLSLNVFGFTGDGSYTIPVSQGGSSVPPQSGGAALSNVRLRVVHGTGEEAPSQTYGIVAKPCTVSLSREGDAGELRCQRLRDPRGPQVGMTVTWRAT